MPDDCPRPRNRLEEALSLLDPPSRRVMELWLQGATVGDMATQLALPTRALEVMRKRAIAKVREFIAQRAAPESPEEPGTACS